MTWKEYHSRSEQYASEAQMAKIARDFDRAKNLYGLAAEQEELALSALDPSKARTLGITAVSAVALWYKASEFEKARELASHWLNTGLLLPFAQAEIQELLSEIEKVEGLMTAVEQWRASVPVSFSDREKLIKAVEEWKTPAA